MIRLLVVDDHAMFRDGLVRFLENEADFEVAGHYSGVQEALAALSSEPSVVLLDVDLGDSRAIEFVDAARAVEFAGRILIVTAGMSGQEAVQLVQAGASGIVHKHHSMQVLCSNIRKVAAGEACIEPEYLAALFRTVDRTRASSRPKLTERDRVVLKGIFHGLSNKEIASTASVSEGAIKASIRQLFEKLKVRTRAQAVKIALEQYRDEL